MRWGRKSGCYRQTVRAAGSALVAFGALVLVLSSASSASARGHAIPAGNLTANPSFQQGTTGWSGYEARVKRVKDRTAPDGRRAAKVTRTGTGGYAIDDDPATVPGGTPAGSTFTATAWVKRSGRTRGKVELVVRETTPEGALVSEGRSIARLRNRFRKVRVSYTAAGDGNQIDLYVGRPEGSSGRRFLVDAISLVPSGASVTTVSQIATGSTTEGAILAEQGSRYRYIVIRDSLHDRVDEIRAANPNSKILLYKDVSFVIDDASCRDEPYQGSGVGFCEANPHEDWFLHDGSGERLRSSDYPYLQAANIGNPGYQQAWYESVVERLRDANGDGSNVRYDGVFMDDTNLYPGHGMEGEISELTDAQYREATESFVDYVGPRLKEEGFTVMPNLALGMWDPAQREATMHVAQDVSAINREGFVRWGKGPLFTHPVADSGAWMDELTLMEEIQAAGAGYMGIVYGAPGDVQAQRYARATFLLGWNGRDGSSLAYRTDAGDAYLPDWTIDVGTPAGPREKVGGGWRRDFTGGTVVLNPSPEDQQTFPLGGSYRQPDGSCTSSVTLDPRGALVLPAC
jgi:Hypothetical glycosyl hydrolase family 15